MSEKRRDNRNRILRNGESQRKDGRYAFKYIDATGKPQFVYSWKLEKTDKLPTGKRDDLSLWEKEKLTQKDIDDQIVPRGGEMTVEELVRKYLMQKTGVRHNTEANYNFVLNIIKKEEFGKRRIDKVKQSDAKCWLIKLQQDGRGYSSIHSIRGVVRPAFQMAVDDDLIRKNPFEFQLATVVVNDSVTREAITRKQERAFLEFVASDKHFCKSRLQGYHKEKPPEMDGLNYTLIPRWRAAAWDKAKGQNCRTAHFCRSVGASCTRPFR